jgi:hypothetical protein
MSDDEAAAVVGAIEAHVESAVNNNIKAVEGKLTGMQATLDPMKGQIQFVGVMIGVVGLAIAAGPILARFIR